MQVDEAYIGFTAIVVAVNAIFETGQYWGDTAKE